MYAEHFSIENIPFGIASSNAHPARCVVTRLGDTVIFLDKFAGHDKFSEDLQVVLSQSTINSLAALPTADHQKLRAKLQKTLCSDEKFLFHHEDLSAVQMHLPVDIRGFTDFSCSKEHCLNAGEAIMNKRQLPPGFLHFPIGYTGRASSIVVYRSFSYMRIFLGFDAISGTPIIRPKGQFRQDEEVVYGPTKQLDYELEVAAIIGKSTTLGDTVPINRADEYIFGLVLINDWSARDIQGLEMSPLGPMNGKSFATTMSPWIITLDALESFESTAPPKSISVASYLQDNKLKNTYDIHLQADLITTRSTTTICKSELKWMYWTLRDLVSHQTANGCNLNTADILATGTISGTTKDSHGCLLELTRGGKESFVLEGGDSRTYLEDGDTVRLTAELAPGIGFGECLGTIVPARRSQAILPSRSL